MTEGSAAPLPPGATFLERYRIGEPIGRGGMGVVVAAHHLVLDQRVAIKFLTAASAGRTRAKERFEREARAAAKLNNEHVARILDAGAMPSGVAYIIMEHLAGEDLGALLRRVGPLPPKSAIDYVLQALDGLADAHAAGIVHRDLKPSNLFVTARANGRPLLKIVDFGIAKMDDVAAEQGTLTGEAILGTPRYMSPEQLQSTRSVDRRADLWAMGVILYELLSGRAPYEGKSAVEILRSILAAEPPPLRTLRAEIPQALDALVHRCLALRPADRFSSVEELAAALAPFAGARSRGLVDRFVVDRTATAHVAAKPPSARGRRTRNAWVIAVAAALAAGASVYAWLGRGSSSPSSPSSVVSSASPSVPSASASVAPSANATESTSAGVGSAKATATIAPLPAPTPRPSHSTSDELPMLK